MLARVLANVTSPWNCLRLRDYKISIRHTDRRIVLSTELGRDMDAQERDKRDCRSVDPQTLHGNVHQVDDVPNGPTNSAAITTMFPLRVCEGKPLVAVTRERRYGPSRLRVNDDDVDQVRALTVDL